MNKHNYIQRRFDEVFDLQMGKTPNRKEASFFGGDNVWLSIRDMGPKYIDESNEHITDDAIKASGIKIVKRGTVIMSFKLTVGKCGIASRDLYTNEAIMAFNVKEGFSISPDFLYFYLQGYKWQGTNKAVMGLTLNKATISKQIIDIPPISAQERIVAELDLLSGIIEKKKEQLKAYDQLAQSIFYTMFGDPIDNPKGWPVKKLGEVCIIERGGSPRPIEKYLTEDINGINWIKIGDATEGGMVIESTKQRIIHDGLKKSRFVHKGDFLLSNSMSFGKPYILGVDGCIHDGWLVIQDINNTFNKIYLYFFLGSPQTYESFKSMAVGGVVNNLNKDVVKRVKVALPPLALQREFAEKVEAIERQKALVQRSIEETQTMFDYTMDKYFG